MEPRPAQEQIKTEKRKTNTALKVSVLFALIALLIVGILLPIKLVPNAVSTISSKVSSWFERSDRVRLVANTSPIVSGQEFTLSWNSGLRPDGSYVLNYECLEGVTVTTSIIRMNDTITCSEPYYFTPISSSIPLTISIGNNRYADISVSLGFLPNNSANVETIGTLTLGVTNPNSKPVGTNTPATTTKPVVRAPKTDNGPEIPEAPDTTKPRVTRVYRQSNPNGSTDLRIIMAGFGILNDDGEYIQTTAVPAGTRAAVQFIVSNAGDKTSNLWSFTAKLPAQNNRTYTARNLDILGPGDSILFTLGFDNLDNSTQNRVTITVSGDDVATNNTASTDIKTITR